MSALNTTVMYNLRRIRRGTSDNVSRQLIVIVTQIEA